ncbi:diguanylate cyclase domain-containing protein [Sulfurimonas autotrophica]|uniref:diguanylate cyclase n=1 Tax=Sulfurimonas autotrophica (strain ATCC BAA-671 / DSM 16294 / JCM 11897 / OK10) TaxID=563040 RepID=E0UTD8_SULAO|nr:diguanylate cyclase [Sulfurimonas autotrophica]ADN09303.1 diguanylate cyclase [Sulfurimonas autotrophica DSM 16294]
MKYSIKRIFEHLKIYLLFIFFVAFFAVLLTFEQQLSFDKVNNLNNQKNIIKTLTKLNKSDIELALIQFNGKSTQLHQEIGKLKMIYKYNLTDRFLLGKEREYLNDLNQLSNLTDKFNNAAHEYYIETKNPKLGKEAKIHLDKSLKAITQHIDNMLLKSISYNQEKFNIVKVLFIIIFILVLFATFWYRKMLTAIYRDIEYLFQVEKNKSNYEIFSMEADAIALRMNRKSVVHDNPSMLDPVTEINNYKGLLNSYASKKGLKDSNFTAVAILEIDNFSKSNRAFTQEVTQAILRKVAYTISLHEQPIDVIARTDYNQFTVVLSRSSREQLFKDIEIIRESIAELKFNAPDNGSILITVTGGFIIKPNNTSLEEAMKQAKEILEYAKTTGKNRIFQQRDLAHKDM